MTDLSLPRETGSEKSDLECPICGGLVPAVTSAYGSISPGACPVCWPAAAPTQLAAQVAAANAPDPAGEPPVAPSDPVDVVAARDTIEALPPTPSVG
jgi:RecA/RadA recombinase